MINKITSTFCFLLISLFAHAQAEKVYEFNSTCQQAYQEIIKLKVASGVALIEKAKQQNPDNIIPYYLDSYVDLISLFFSEDAADYAIKKPKIEERIKLLEQGQQNSPFYRYCLSMAYLQKAFIEIKFVETWRASWDVRKAFLLIKENKKIFPTFAPNDLIYGGLQSVIATIPSGYSFFASFVGLSGSIDEGMKLLKGFANSSDPYAKLMSSESAFIYCYLLYNIENKKPEVFTFIQNKKLDLVNNYLLAYMTANLAITDKQLAMAEKIINNRNKSPEYYNLPIWDYEMGYIKLYHLDVQEAAKYLESYLASFKGKFYIKDTYLKLSWCYYLAGNTRAAENARANILKKGATDTDADKQALKDAKSGIWPNMLLLKSRMLSDGGYYAEALAILNGKSINSFATDEEKLEYVYRLGRIYDDMHKNEEAIQYYNTAISIGVNRREYYAARAALQIGEIYERQGKKKEALAFFQKCLDMKDHEYKNSLDQKAKTGIERCGD
ncbi:tetratricopeptide repeat protein [Parasediminibacterium sp. JCM 36343]|uniref:tetratricopeptide repeat protein n=1 Tax=Parasediminibacterium sp. JCM 36343 TaxID=3374279 RepID=UPI003978BAE2